MCILHIKQNGGLFSDSLCEQNEGTVQYFYIIIVYFCTQNVLKDLIRGINRQIQKYMKTTSFQKAVYLTAAL